MIGRPVSEPVLPFTAPLLTISTYSRYASAALEQAGVYVEMVSKGAVKGKTGSLTGLPIIETQAGDVTGVRADQRHLDH